MSKINLPKLPQKAKKKILQGEIRAEIHSALIDELDRNGVKICEMLDWSARAYLLTSNPKEAAKLGIFAEDSAK
jgi:hypothetical protein